MLFSLPPEILAAATQDDEDNLTRLLDRARLLVHDFVIEDGAQLLQSQWYQTSRPRDQEYLRYLVQADAYLTGSRLRIAHDFSLEISVRLAHQPLIVWVENDRSDGKLVAAAVRLFGSERLVTLWRSSLPTGAAVETKKGGGVGELKKTLQGLLQQRDPKELRLRTVVVTDGDARWPADVARGWPEDLERTREAREIASLCKQYDISCLVLSCRSAENYLPDAALDRWSADRSRLAARPQVEALKRLTPEQRDHILMKGKKPGLDEVDGTAPLPQRELYAGVTEADRESLRGFHDEIIGLMEDPHLTSNELDSRDLRGDLRKLAKLIEEAL